MVAPVACVLIGHALVTVLVVIVILSTAVQLTESLHFAIVDWGEGLASLLIASQCWVLWVGRVCIDFSTSALFCTWWMEKRRFRAVSSNVVALEEPYGWHHVPIIRHIWLICGWYVIGMLISTKVLAELVADLVWFGLSKLLLPRCILLLHVDRKAAWRHGFVLLWKLHFSHRNDKLYLQN